MNFDTPLFPSYMQLLGTAAADYIGIEESENENCKDAVKSGGRNLRTSSSVFLYPDTIIDFSAEIPKQMQRFNVDKRAIQHIVITHPHYDHFDPPSILRICIDRKNATGKVTHIYGNSWVVELIKSEERKYSETGEYTVTHLLEPQKKHQVGNFHIIPVEANHPEGLAGLDANGVEKYADGIWVALNYIIQIDHKNVLYAADTGWPIQKTYEIYQQYRFNMVVHEGTFGFREMGERPDGHTNFPIAEELRNAMIEDGIILNTTPFILTHLSLAWCPIYDKIAPAFAKKGIIIGYDGMVIPF